MTQYREDNMIRSVRIIACGLALAISTGGLAAAAASLAPSTTVHAPKLAADTGEKRLQRRQHRQRDHYRDRRSSHRDHYRDRRGSHRDHYRDRRGSYRDHGDRRRARHDYRGNRRYEPRCWSESQRSRFRGRPAVVSVRVCRDRHGRAYTVRGSARLIRYLRGHRRHW